MCFEDLNTERFARDGIWVKLPGVCFGLNAGVGFAFLMPRIITDYVAPVIKVSDSAIRGRSVLCVLFLCALRYLCSMHSFCMDLNYPNVFQIV